MQRLEVHFSGHVQGVGFRYQAHQIASQFAVTGFVMNLADGRVKLVAEGSKSELNGLVAEIKQRMDGYIRETDQETLAATHEFDGFAIQR